ncbi:spore coat protein U domain-containing protein [Chitinilyticum piscinae]|uniref:Spore coat protein U domain-containing protein n=1 Tax=Chitinilyticum piscinae TaxID=2866724 RepID=A0A8J7FYS4_9NEIS|nr:spore coat protein U domain-containing protein [Chitinilyticum piscinae]MBE9608168.1 spore coat protein U domain-containing protein [Chitinilyticum piscinae]
MSRALIIPSLAIAALLASGHAMAASKNVIINANVVGTCAFTDGNDVTINLGDLKAGSGDQSKTGSTSFWCSNGITYNLSTDDGLHGDASQKKMAAGEHQLPYALALERSTGTGQGIASPETLTLTATVKGADLDVAPVASGYSDTVVLTLTP